ncbi:MAG: glycosyltransferase family 39 protein [Bacteroidales bacterium]|nr:glycosyltransferase family 39 protein [Bacteroidales bacterium]
MSSNWKKSLKPDAVVTLLLAVWWLLNVAQAAVTGLANDEAYYWYFAQNLDWGYFDHPPMVALLVKLSSWLPGALGIRFMSTLLQPLYLLIFWHMIKPAEATLRQAAVYVLICFSMPLLQLYGFLAVPDAPLLMFTVLFWWAWRRFVQSNTVASAALLGLMAALLGYSKYHGALVVLFTVLSNPKMLKRWQLYLAGAVALVLYAPHLWWQYSHDWVSFGYHLAGRNRAWQPSFTTDFLLNLLLVMNPLWIYYYIRGTKSMFASFDPLRRAMAFTWVGFPVVFLLSTLRGHTQPQWILPAVLPAVCLLFDEARDRKFLVVGSQILVLLYLIVRVLAVANPFGFKGEIWNNREAYNQLAELADGRPIVFMSSYTAPAKYQIYTGGEAYGDTYYFRRSSQWQYDTSDRAYAHRDVVVGNFTNHTPNRLELADGRTFYYREYHDYKPLREIKVTPTGNRFATVDSTGRLLMEFAVDNPYPYDVLTSEGDTVGLQLAVAYEERNWPGFRGILHDTIPAYGTAVVRCSMAPPAKLPSGTYRGNISIGRRGARYSANSPLMRVKVERSDTSLSVSFGD